MTIFCPHYFPFHPGRFYYQSLAKTAGEISEIESLVKFYPYRFHQFYLLPEELFMRLITIEEIQCHEGGFNIRKITLPDKGIDRF